MSPALLLLLAACPWPEGGTGSTGGTTTATTTSTGTTPTLCDDGVPALALDTSAVATFMRWEKAAPFSVKTLAGDWSLEEHWTGCDVYLFIQGDPVFDSGWDVGLFERDLDDLLAWSPRNVHWFFLSDASSTEDVEAEMELLQADFDKELTDLSEEDQAWWADRLHYVSKRDSNVGGWLEEHVAERGTGIGIDRHQRVRDLGSPTDPSRDNDAIGWFDGNIAMYTGEAALFNWEAARDHAWETRKAAAGSLYVPVWDQALFGDTAWNGTSLYADLILPNAESMKAYDTLQLEMIHRCGEGDEYRDCPPWDYLANTYVCDLPLVSDNPYATTPCQPAVAEVLGQCVDDFGKATGLTCRADEDCASGLTTTDPGTSESWTCDGYEPAVAADTLADECSTPLGDVVEAKYTCLADGTGYGDLACACGTELGRWVTTYWREGHWVSDVSPLLALLKDGGHQRIRYHTYQEEYVSMNMLLSNQGKGGSPQEAIFLWKGGAFNASYNDLFQPASVPIPADAKRVELVATISGHGFGTDRANCAEFCDHQHFFTVNGGSTYEVTHPEAGSELGCFEKAGTHGVVPGQSGTWWYGRGGWCPGQDVAPHVWDITGDVTPGADASISYTSLMGGREYTETDVSANIVMDSWVVIYR